MGKLDSDVVQSLDLELTFIVLSRSDDSKAGKITGTNALLAQCDMAGDVNVFISELEETDDGENAEPAAPLPVKYKGELEVMIAGKYLEASDCISLAGKLTLS